MGMVSENPFAFSNRSPKLCNSFTTRYYSLSLLSDLNIHYVHLLFSFLVFKFIYAQRVLLMFCFILLA